MKTNRILSAALIVFAATACNSDYISENMTGQELEPMTIAEVGTKTSFNQADGSVKWTSGDQILIFDNLGGRNLFQNTADAVSTFTGNVTAGTTKFWGIYPATRVEGCSNGVATVTLPFDQKAKEGSFDNGTNISVTTGTKTPGTPEVSDIQFHNVCGMISFDIPARIAANYVKFTAHNRNIAGTISVNCNDEKPTATIIDDGNGSNSVEMSGTFKAGSRFYFVVAPGTIEGFEIEVKTEKGSTFGRSACSGKIEVVAGKVTNLKEINFTDGAASASADHTYSNGQLTGTTLTINHGIPETMWKDVTALSLTAKKGDVTYREYSATSVNGASVTPTTGKIYLPQGTYIISGSYTMNGVQTEIKITDVTVKAPTGISLTSINGVTSYSLAKGGDVTNANNHQADRIIPKATVSGVSAAVLSEVPLSYTFSLSNGKSVSGTTTSTAITGANIDGNAWATHTLTASGTFDGVSVAGNGSSDCHITGLPYSITTTTSNPTGWTVNNTDSYWNTDRDYLLMKTENSYVISPVFHAPDSYNVNVVLNAYAYKGWSSYSPKVTFAASSTGQKGSSEQTITSSDAYPYTAPFKDYSGKITFNTNVSQACIYTSGKYGIGVAGFTRSVVVHHISIYYSN